MNKTLQDMRVTFDPNLPRVDRLRKMAEIPGVQKLLSLIQKQESNGGDYNVVNGGGKPRINGKLLTECTVAEIIDAQAKGSRTQWGGQTEAAGAFQVMPDTLLASVKRLGINPQTTLFNKQTQDLIGMDLMENRGLSAFLTGGMKLSDFMLGIAKEWAGMPLDETGKAYHGGSANNPSFVSPEVGKAVTETLKGLRPT
jgi:muramidase (phage lysozyme)